MKELQGAIIIGSAFQTFIGYSGLMSLLVRYDCGIFMPVYLSCFLVQTLLFHHTAFILVGNL